MPNEAIDQETGEVIATAVPIIPIDRRHLRAVRLFAAEKDIRYYLNGVLVHVLDDGAVRLVATNGGAIAITHTPRDDFFPPPPGKIIIPIDVVKMFAQREGDHDIKVSTLDGKTYKMECVGLSVNFEPIEAKYPSYEAVLPRAISNEPYQYDPDLLMRFGKAAEIYSGKGNRGIHIEYNGAGAALVHLNDHSFIGVVMPWRVSLKTGMPGWITPGGVSVTEAEDDDVQQPELPGTPPIPEADTGPLNTVGDNEQKPKTRRSRKAAEMAGA